MSATNVTKDFAIKEPSLKGEDKDSTSGLNRTLYCGSCSQGFETIGKLHDHLINHDSNGSYYYDHLLRTAFPRCGTACSGTQTEYDFVDITEKKGDVVTTLVTDSFGLPIRRDVIENLASNIRNRSLELENVYESSIITTNAPRNAGECKTKMNINAQDSRLKNSSKISMSDDIQASTKTEICIMDLQHEVRGNEIPNEHVRDEGECNDDMHLYTEYSESCEETPQCDVGNSSAPVDRYESLECNESQMQAKSERVEKAKPKRAKNKSEQRKSKIDHIFKRNGVAKEKLDVIIERKVASKGTSAKTRPGEGSVECHICKRRVYSKEYLKNKHLKLHEGQECQCEKCGEMFVVDRIKRKFKKYKCKCALLCALCKKTFATKKSLTKHMKHVHSDTRPFICEICGSGFKCNSVLKDHLRVHDTVRTRYPCSHCDLTFSTHSALQRHTRSHTGQFNEQCSVCGKTLISKWNLKAHMRQHTGDKPYTCDHCGLGFTHNVSRKNHMAKHHGIPRT